MALIYREYSEIARFYCIVTNFFSNLGSISAPISRSSHFRKTLGFIILLFIQFNHLLGEIGQKVVDGIVSAILHALENQMFNL